VVVKVVRVVLEQVVLVVLVVDKLVAQALLVPVKIILEQLSKVIQVVQDLVVVDMLEVVEVLVVQEEVHPRHLARVVELEV
jgi:hypothetical protein